jgi:DNA-binding HxlR family transcriptional regulator
LDRFDREIIQILSKAENMTFNQIKSKVGFSHNTLQQHLEELLDKGLVERRKRQQGRPGRPTYIYGIPNNLKGRPLTAITTPESNWVVISFDSLSRLCRHEKGGYCKEIRGPCRARYCPKTLK